MNTAYLILGGNIGNKQENMNRAQELIAARAGSIIRRSDIFVTAAWGHTEQPDFYNVALQIETMLTAQDLLAALLKIETDMGRVRTQQKWTERTMDIDILFYNDALIDEPHLHVPHPFIQERRFVLAPLAEIAADLIHPGLQKSITQLLAECTDSSDVQRLTHSNT